MKRTVLTCLLCACALAGAISAGSSASADASARLSSPAQQPVSFERDIQPILQNSCLGCHGQLGMSGLDLRTREGALKGGKSGSALVAGKSDESRLYRRIAGLEEPAMPLEGTTLTAAQITLIKTWIDEGAHWDLTAGTASTDPSRTTALAALEKIEIPVAAREYWAFKLPVQAPLPPVGRGFAHPVDRFLERARREKGLETAPRAARAMLVRRAYLDLIGLPPTPAETAAFLADTRADAWERLIDTLLASPHYGERWGRHWLDVARYADSGGFEHDYDRPNAWRYRDYVIRSFNQDKPYDAFLREQIAGDELDAATTDETLIATGFLRAGPRVGFREKDNPERRYEYIDDVIATTGRGILGLTVQCARCHNHKFDPIPQRDYYSLATTFFGYVETTHPLVPRDQAEAYERQVREIGERQKLLRSEIEKLDAPYEARLRQDAYKRYPEMVQRAIAKPAGERSAGERLLADQVIESVNIPARAIDAVMTPDDAARKKALSAEIAALDKERPPPIPVAEIVTDGDYRFAPDGAGDEVIGCPKCRIPPDTPGSFLHAGPGRYQAPPSHFLIRGDPNARGSVMSPGFVTVATYGNPPTEIPPASGRTSGRRRALAEWLASPTNPLTARVIVNRIWHHHFGRGIVSTLDNFGKMGEPPTHPALLDWLAVEFMNRGWSIKAMHRLLMTSEAYQMASSFEQPGNQEKDAQNHFLWKFRTQRLDAEIVRDSILSVGGAINLASGGPPVFPVLPKELLTSVSHGIWKNEEDGPTVWRRSVYVYRRRGLAFPMFQVFDLPEQNVSAGARTVSTVPTQALALLNDRFVLGQAKLFADRVRAQAGNDVERQIDLAYRIALTRPPSRAELAAALPAVTAGSLEDLTHVLFNLNEFVYLR